MLILLNLLFHFASKSNKNRRGTNKLQQRRIYHVQGSQPRESVSSFTQIQSSMNSGGTFNLTEDCLRGLDNNQDTSDIITPLKNTKELKFIPGVKGKVINKTNHKPLHRRLHEKIAKSGMNFERENTAALDPFKRALNHMLESSTFKPKEDEIKSSFDENNSMDFIFSNILEPDTAQLEPESFSNISTLETSVNTFEFSYLENSELFEIQNYFECPEELFENPNMGDDKYLSPNTKTTTEVSDVKACELNSQPRKEIKPVLTNNPINPSLPKIHSISKVYVYEIIIPISKNYSLRYEVNEAGSCFISINPVSISKMSWFKKFKYVLNNVLWTNRFKLKELELFKDPIFRFYMKFRHVVSRYNVWNVLLPDFTMRVRNIYFIFNINLQCYSLLSKSTRFQEIQLAYIKNIQPGPITNLHLDVLQIQKAIDEIISLLQTETFELIKYFLPELSSLAANLEKIKFKSINDAIIGLLVLSQLEKTYQIFKLVHRLSENKNLNILCDLSFLSISNTLRSLFAIFIQYLDIDILYYKNICNIIDIYVVVSATLQQNYTAEIPKYIDNLYLSKNFFELAICLPDVDKWFNDKSITYGSFYFACQDIGTYISSAVERLKENTCDLILDES